MPWKIIGPFGLDTPLPQLVTPEVHPTVVPIQEPTPLQESWQDGEMRAGFFDATYRFRHYALIEGGTGFVAGRGQTRMLTYLYSPSERRVRVILGHDDRVLLRLNDVRLADIAARRGFGPYPLALSLHGRWNKLDLMVANDENLDWRWWWDFACA